MENNSYYSGTLIRLIHFELEICPDTGRPCPPVIRSALRHADRLAKEFTRSLFEERMESDVPLFHPGRVFVSHQAMIWLGRRTVLAYLNCHVRGEWADGAAAGAKSWGDLENNCSIWSNYHLGCGVALSLRTGKDRSRTVIRFFHETLGVFRGLLSGEHELIQEKIEKADDAARKLCQLEKPGGNASIDSVTLASSRPPVSSYEALASALDDESLPF